MNKKHVTRYHNRYCVTVLFSATSTRSSCPPLACITITPLPFKSLSACGVDVVELKRSIAALLKFRTRAYRAMMLPRPLAVMWTIASVPLPAPQRAPPVLALPPLPPLLPPTLHLLLLIGQWTPVKCLSCVVLCMFCICN